MLFKKQLKEEICLIMACLYAALIFLFALHVFPQHACKRTFHFAPIYIANLVAHLH